MKNRNKKSETNLDVLLGVIWDAQGEVDALPACKYLLTIYEAASSEVLDSLPADNPHGRKILHQLRLVSPRIAILIKRYQNAVLRLSGAMNRLEEEAMSLSLLAEKGNL